VDDGAFADIEAMVGVEASAYYVDVVSSSHFLFFDCEYLPHSPGGYCWLEGTPIGDNQLFGRLHGEAASCVGRD
jgi:hypothetical protein